MQRIFAFRQDRGDGLDLRSLSHGGEKVISRLYFAVRDEWWRTVPLSITGRRREDTPSGFVIEIDAVTAWESHPAEVSLRYVAEGDELLAEFTATAGGPFTYGRIGFCLLFPMDGYRGRSATSWRSGAATDFAFPTEIITRDRLDEAAARFHRPFDRLETTLASGTRVSYAFEGEEFEFEDQRNWTDASYKAYSSRPPGGTSTADGGRFSQRVRIRVEPADGSTVARGDDPAIRLGGPIGVAPSIGLYRGRISPNSFRPHGGFHELNSTRLDAAAHDSVELAVNGSVHAADDDSVLETTALHGLLVEQARAAHPDLPLRLAPVSFLDVAGDWRDEAGEYAPAPPEDAIPPRMLGAYAATWAIASAAQAVPAGPDMLRYFDAALPADSPAGRTVARLAALNGREVLEVSAPAPLAALAVVVDDTVTLAVANPGPDATRFRLPDGRSAILGGFASSWFELPWDPLAP